MKAHLIGNAIGREVSIEKAWQLFWSDQWEAVWFGGLLGLALLVLLHLVRENTTLLTFITRNRKTGLFLVCSAPPCRLLSITALFLSSMSSHLATWSGLLLLLLLLKQ